ncbi:MAG: hypothetical protein CMA88_02350 [Euryarchaeota archaeon]|nr:hypothetical protein [Euryarchaeota archaeon]
MATQEVVSWGCSVLVILGIGYYVVLEMLKRWRVGLRLAALDESLIEDGGVMVEEIMEAPLGSVVVDGSVAEFLGDDYRG